MSFPAGERRQVPRYLVVPDHLQPPHMPHLARERRGQEHLRERDRVGGRMHPRAQAQHVGVVVQAGQPGRLLAPDQRRPDPGDLVGGDLLAVTRAADHDRDAVRVGRRGGRGAHDIGRVVVAFVVGRRAAIGHLVPGRGQPVGEDRLQLEPGMIGSQVDAHARQSRTPQESAAGSGGLVEDGVAVAAALQLEEAVDGGHRQHAVPQPARVLAARDRGHHGPEDGRAVDRDHRRADVVPDPVHAVPVGGPQRLVVLGRVHRVRERRGQADLGQRRLDGGAVAFRLLVVEPGADRGVEGAQYLRARRLLGRDAHPHRAPGPGHELLVPVRQVLLALVQDGQAHDVPARLDRAHLGHFHHPARGDPGPGTLRVKPEIDRRRLLLGHFFLLREISGGTARAAVAGTTPDPLRPVAVACNRAARPGIPRRMARMRNGPGGGAARCGRTGKDSAVTNNLTRDEAHERAGLLQAVSYQVELDLTAGEETFPSVSTVIFRCARPGAASFIDLTAPAASEIILNGEPVAADAFDGNRIALTGLAAENELRVVARCAYSRSGEGMHRFADPADGGVYLYTDLETFDAHRVYACFDQPDLKASFEFTVTAPDGWQVISNMAPDVAGAPAGDARRWHFPPSPVMSTYITFAGAGPYHAVRSEHDGIPLGIYCRASLARYLDPEEIFEVTRQGFDFFHGAFGVRYPFVKYDQLFVPEYKAGAMENAGAVTFLEDYIFRSRVTDFAREARGDTILHEMAHMWFGDLVTMRWWDDLWLNESFATWAATIAQAEATRWTHAWTTFAQLHKSWAYRQDQLPSTHPIAADIPDIAAVEVNFDGITYAKGAAVLKQLVAYVGIDNFLAGVRRYFDQHAWSNASLADLLAPVADTSGRDLAGWSKQWLETAGVNTLRPEYATGFAIVQEAPPSHPVLRDHRIAIGLYDRTPGGLVRRLRVETDVSGERTDIGALAGEQRPD